MRAGDMTHRVIIQRGAETRDTFGEAIKTWTTLAQVWAAIDWRTGSEPFLADHDHPEIPATVTVRRSTDTMSVQEKDRVLVPMAATTLKDGLLTVAGTSLVLDTPAVMPPDADFLIRIESELVQVTAGSGTSGSPYTVTRGACGTTAAKHGPGTSAVQMAILDIESAYSPTPKTVVIQAIRSEVRA